MSRLVSSVAQTLSGLRDKRLTTEALIEQTIAAAEACQAGVNAFSLIARNEARASAARSEQMYLDNRARPLEGLPIVVKDLIDTKGIETRYGSQAYLGHLPSRDAEIVDRLVEQGAIVIGKATTHEFAWGVTTASPAFGDTLNPRDPTRIPGGSSGGTAAAIGYGAVACGLGTDTGGSVRIPAALCGIVGMKPSQGVWPTTGIFPLAPTLDHPGLMGASVGDIVVLAEALGMAVNDVELEQPALGIVREVPPVPLSPEVAAPFDQAVRVIEARLGRAVRLNADFFAGVFSHFAGIVLAEAGAIHFARNDEATIAKYLPETRERLDRARSVSIDDYKRSQEGRRSFSRRLSESLSQLDFLMLPTCPCVAPPLGTENISIEGWSGNIREALMTYTAPFNLSGFPAISIPMRPSPNGLPCGLQIVAKPGQDAALLRFALKIESILALNLADPA